MPAMTVAERMSAQQFLAMPEHPPAQWQELIDGELVVSEPGLPHNYVQTDLVFALGDWSRSKPGRGRVVLPLDVGIDDRNVFEPDVAWYAEGRVPPRAAEPPFAVPDLAARLPTLPPGCTDLRRRAGVRARPANRLAAAGGVRLGPRRAVFARVGSPDRGVMGEGGHGRPDVPGRPSAVQEADLSRPLRCARLLAHPHARSAPSPAVSTSAPVFSSAPWTLGWPWHLWCDVSLSVTIPADERPFHAAPSGRGDGPARTTRSPCRHGAADPCSTLRRGGDAS